MAPVIKVLGLLLIYSCHVIAYVMSSIVYKHFDLDLIFKVTGIIIVNFISNCFGGTFCLQVTKNVETTPQLTSSDQLHFSPKLQPYDFFPRYSDLEGLPLKIHSQ